MFSVSKLDKLRLVSVIKDDMKYCQVIILRRCLTGICRFSLSNVQHSKLPYFGFRVKAHIIKLKRWQYY